VNELITEMCVLSLAVMMTVYCHHKRVTMVHHVQ